MPHIFVGACSRSRSISLCFKVLQVGCLRSGEVYPQSTVRLQGSWTVSGIHPSALCSTTATITVRP